MCNLAEGIMRNISVQIFWGNFGNKLVKLFLNLDQWFSRRCHFKIFLFSSGSHWETSCAILVESCTGKQPCEIILYLNG